MFFHRHRRPPILLLLLALFGLRTAKRCCNMSDEERSEFRQKRQLFRSKLREACAVWRETPAADAEAAPESESAE